MRLLLAATAALMLACAGLGESSSSGNDGEPVDLTSPPRQTVSVTIGTGEVLSALTGDEIEALMTGNSLVGAYTGGNDTACEYHGPTGQIIGFYREPYTASWYRSGDTICYVYGDRENCQWMVVTDQGLLANHVTPDGALLTTSQVLRGDVCR